MTNAEIGAAFREHGEWLRAQTAELDELLTPKPFSTLTPRMRVHFRIALQGLLCLDPDFKRFKIEEQFRCRWCKSPRTRYRLTEVGEECLVYRCLRCGGLHEFLVPPTAAAA